MSPLWRERVTITLAPQQVTLERYARGSRTKLKDRRTLDCAIPATEPAWQPALDALRDALAHPMVTSADASVVLSNHFVRYLLLPWNPGLAGGAEELAYARERFRQVFGDVAQKWDVRLSRAGYGVPLVASAVDPALLQSLQTALAGSVLRLRSVQPALMTVFNARPRAPGGDACLIVAESGRLLIGWLRCGAFHSLRSRALNGKSVALAELIEQEYLLLGVEPGANKIFLHTHGECALDPEGLDVDSWLPEPRTLRAGGYTDGAH